MKKNIKTCKRALPRRQLMTVFENKIIEMYMNITPKGVEEEIERLSRQQYMYIR